MKDDLEDFSVAGKLESIPEFEIAWSGPSYRENEIWVLS